MTIWIMRAVHIATGGRWVEIVNGWWAARGGKDLIAAIAERFYHTECRRLLAGCFPMY